MSCSSALQQASRRADSGDWTWRLLLFPHSLKPLCWLRLKHHIQCYSNTSSLYLTLQSVYLFRQLHGVPAEVIHGDGVVPVAQVVLLTRWLLLPPHTAHSQQHSYSRQIQERKIRVSTVADRAAALKKASECAHSMCSGRGCHVSGLLPLIE